MFLRNSNFCFNFLGHVEKWLDKNVNVNFKTHDVRTREQKIAINILSNISRIKSDQAMKFG